MHRLVSTLWLDLNWAWTFMLGCFGTMARCTSRIAELFWGPRRCWGRGSCCQHVTPHRLVQCHLGCCGIIHLYVFARIWLRFPIFLQFCSIHSHWASTTLGQALYSSVQFSSVQFSSVAQSCRTLCNSMNCSTPGLPVHHQLPEFTQTHVHWVGDAVQPSHPLSSPSLPAPNPSQHQGLFQCTVHGTRPLKSLWPSAETVRLLMEDPDSGFTISDLMSSWWRQLVKNQCVLHQANKNK